jgi:hypothetical protein
VSSRFRSLPGFLLGPALIVAALVGLGCGGSGGEHDMDARW